jgi:hypothetical protein
LCGGELRRCWEGGFPLSVKLLFRGHNRHESDEVLTKISPGIGAIWVGAQAAVRFRQKEMNRSKMCE